MIVSPEVVLLTTFGAAVVLLSAFGAAVVSTGGTRNVCVMLPSGVSRMLTSYCRLPTSSDLSSPAM